MWTQNRGSMHPGTDAAAGAVPAAQGVRIAARGRGRHAPRVTLAFAAPALLALSVAAAPAVVPGEYAVTSQIIMPHLDDMRRHWTTGTACVTGATPGPLFSVLQQYALRGCELGYEARDATGAGYVLVCESARVATGSARLETIPAGISGTLAIKMGGKNMTFTQHVTATRTGDCTAAFHGVRPLGGSGRPAEGVSFRRRPTPDSREESDDDRDR